jgi:hypothetical protein
MTEPASFARNRNWRWVPNSKRCGFCGLHCTVFQEWADHVAKHFEDKIEGGPWVMARWQQPWPEPKEDAADDSDDEDDDDEDTDDNSSGDKDNSDRDYPGGAPGASGNPFGDLPSRSYPGAGQGYHGQSGGHSGGSSGPTGGQTWTYRIASEDNPGNIMGSLALQESATVIKVVILLSLIVLGLANAQSSASMDHFQRQLITKMGNGLPVTLVVVLFTYSDWENANFVTNELKRSCHGGQRSACNVRSARKQNMQYVMCVYYATLWSSEICEGAK